MTYYEFSKLYCEIFNESDGLVNKGKWHFPIAKGANLEKLEENLYFKLDILNIEGLLKIKMPTIRESIEFTYKRFNGSKHVSKSITNKGDGISYI
jgi:dTDP-4-dehydrorhamnose reductase